MPTYHYTKDVQRELDGNELSSRGVICGLGGVYWDDGVEHSCVDDQPFDSLSRKSTSELNKYLYPSH